MSDPKDELRARFDDRRPDAETADEQTAERNTDNTGDTHNTHNTHHTHNTSNTEGASGPATETTATRDRRQVALYLTDGTADDLNALYERLDGRSKVAGEGGVEKHAEFMEALVEFAVENEDRLAGRLGIDE